MKTASPFIPHTHYHQHTITINNTSTNFLTHSLTHKQTSTPSQSNTHTNTNTNTHTHPHAGTHELFCVFKPDDDMSNLPESITSTITILKATPVVTWEVVEGVFQYGKGLDAELHLCAKLQGLYVCREREREWGCIQWFVCIYICVSVCECECVCVSV